MSAIPGIAVFDIGKTNKKFFFFDENYNIIEEESQCFKEIKDEDGFACEDIESLTTWIKNKLTEKTKDPAIEMRAINFSAYGASFVHINASGKPVTPLYNYLKPLPRELEERFYNAYGNREEFAASTASPILGHLNSGLQLYALKYHKPYLFQQIETSLHLPQYLGYLTHGQKFSDITSIGCHTALWDFKKNQYHPWVAQEEIDKKLAPLFPSNEIVNTHLGEESVKAGVGLHDSSAAFIPYMQMIHEPFLLLSTGTWCISMNAFNTTPLTVDELKQDCLSYLNYKGTPVKASRLFAGHEHEQEVKKLAAHYTVSADFFHTLKFNPNLLRTETDIFLNNTGEQTSTTPELAYHKLLHDLVMQQKEATDLVLKNSPVQKIFVDGGFAKNEVYMNLLSRAYPGLKVFAANVTQATAVGAALAIHSHWNRNPLPTQLMELKSFNEG